MKLYKIIDGLNVLSIKGSLDIDIKGIAYDSRSVSDGFLFLCIDGEISDGHDYIEKAISKGAIAIVSEKNIKHCPVTMIKVESSRDAMPKISSIFYNNPTDMLKLIGITGTNGKTTTTYLIKSILERWNKKVGLIGTIEFEIGQRKDKAFRTTPESLDLQKLFRDMVDTGLTYGVIEVSSHSLVLNRVNECKFHIGAFTNLSQDHLDFHKTMESYSAAKEKLFYLTHYANVINVDDSEGRRIIDNIRKRDIKLVTYGINEKADIMAQDINLGSEGIEFYLVTPDYSALVKGSIPGLFSVYNCLTAAAVAYAEGVPYNVIREGLEKAEHVPGRMEVLDTRTPYRIIIDYAHTPDGLRNVLKTIRGFTAGRIITVFGCGGNRDKSKRPVMGKIAGTLSDYCIITSDNPRKENPYSIIKEIENGIKNTNCRYICIENRKEAIKEAINHADEGDVVLLSGKGHEISQELADGIIDFDERKIVEGLLVEGN